MKDRIEFQKLLETFCPNVYFQPPSTLTMKYPAIVYSRKSIDNLIANNKKYKKDNSYTVNVIDRNPDSAIAEALMKLDYCIFDRQFITDGLNHISLLIYY